MKIILWTSSIVWVALSFILPPGSYPADSLPSPSQTQGTTAIVFFHSNSSHPEKGPNVTASPPEPALQEPLDTLASSPPSAASETIVLWEAPKPSGSADPEPSQSKLSKLEEPSDTDVEEGTASESVPDPLEPVNRAFFQFNDKLYFWALKPVATVYKDILPQEHRVAVSNFFSNLTTPVRFANCLLQAKFKGAGNEAVRFLVNSTLGFFGLFDQGKDKLQIDKQDRDLGQTLGIWGFPALLYIDWPILGPSNVRDTFGYVGDLFLDPRTYLLDITSSIIVRSDEMVNETSLHIGEYEDFKKAALDPYVALRDAYNQHRQNKIKEK